MKQSHRRFGFALIAAILFSVPTTPPVSARTQLAVPIAKAEAKVWGNSGSKVYHCPGTRYYGNTARGEYLTEPEAQQKGYRAAYGKSCGGVVAAAAEVPEPATAAPLLSKVGGSPAPKINNRDPKVWVNTSSKVYHCPGTRYYGTTKAGVYMSQTEAQAKHHRPAGGKVCE